MTPFYRFMRVALVWAAAIFVLILPEAMLSANSLTPARYAWWAARALTLAAFPAGIAVAKDVLEAPTPWRPLAHAAAALSIVALVVLAVTGFLAPSLEVDGRLLPAHLADMQATANSWEVRNDAAWRFYESFAIPILAGLLGAIGLQVGVWARFAVPPVLRRLLYWVVIIGIMVAHFGVNDSTYEAVVLFTQADVDFAAAYALLLPMGICAGLALPTLALLRGARIVRDGAPASGESRTGPSG